MFFFGLNVFEERLPLFKNKTEQQMSTMNLKEAENHPETICQLSTAVYCVHQHQLSANWVWSWGINCSLNVTHSEIPHFATKVNRRKCVEIMQHNMENQKRALSHFHNTRVANCKWMLLTWFL
jgi:hypothetical protein